MLISYRDEVGIKIVRVDMDGVQFLGGECYFSSNGEEYRIKVEHVIEIVRD